jgi:hypothetical protein
MRRNHCAFLLPLCVLAATVLLAQVIITSTILGAVNDPQGAVVAGAKVSLTNVDTGVQWKASTSANGDYQFPNLIAGHYKVEVVKEGFAQAVSTVVALENGTTQRINIGLKIGKTTETVEVTSAASLIKTDDANISEVIENKFVRDLPMEGRNYLNFAQILPGFNSGTGDNTRNVWGLASASAPGGAMQLNVGGTDYGVGYYIDGLDNNDNWVEGPMMNVNADTIQEVKAEVSNYSAEYGRDVGQISVTTKSGTNDLHGSVYDTFQNAGMNANNPWSNYQGIPRSAYHQNQYGFTVGGPVYIPKVFNGRNKAFFFTSFERLRNSGQTSFTAYVPTAADLAGDFSPWLAGAPAGFSPSQCNGDTTTEPSACRFVIYDPTSYNAGTGLRTAFPGNKVSAQILSTPASQIAQSYLSHFPAPNGYSSTEPGDYDNYSGSYTAGINANNYSVRGDYTIGNRDFVYFRYMHDDGYRINNPNNLLALNTSGAGVVLDPPGLSAGDGPDHRVNTYQFHYVHAFSPSLTNEFNVSWIRGYNFSNLTSQVSKLDNSWLPSLFQNTSTNMAGFTSFDKNLFNIGNDSNFAVNIGDNWTPTFGNNLSLGTDNAGEYWYQYVPIFQLTDNLAKTIGRHSLKAGFYMAHRYERDNDIIRSVTIDGGYTGLGPGVSDGSGFNRLAEFETGLVSSMNQRTPASGGDASLYYGTPEYAAFFSDAWNATRKLTVNLGLRYDLPIPTYSVDNYWGVIDKTYPGWRFVMPGLTPGTNAHPFSADKKDFAPRIGLAYRLGDKTVVRSGYGIFYETGRFKFLDQVTWNSPAYGGSPYTSPYTGVGAYTLGDTFPAPISVIKGSWPYPLGQDGGLMWTPGPGNPVPTSTLDQGTWKTSYIQRWSLDVQRELGKAVVATVGYVGSEGTHLPIQYDLNLFPQGFYPDVDAWIAGAAQCLTCDAARPLTAVAPGRWSAINSVRPAQSNNYNAMNVGLKTRGWHGMTNEVSYVWSKQMDTYFGENGEGGARPLGGQWHPKWSYGPSDANHTNRLVATVVYELPGKTLGNRLLRETVGGWQINSIATFESGAPTTIWNGYTSSYDDMGDVPIQSCNGNLARGDRTFTRAFNTNCYVEPAASTDPYYTNQGIYNYAVTRGNEGRNNLRQPGINNWDMGLQKSWRPFGEGRELQFRADSFNVFNHTQWSGFDTYDDRLTNSASQFGYINGARNGRHMQLNMRFVF